VISSAGGRVSEPDRSNLIRFVSDIRAAGFKRLTISFGPQWTNDPVGSYLPDGTIEDHWDPAKLDENWSFIADVHRLVKPYAPADTVFDILSEIPPSSYQPAWAITRLDEYIGTIWSRYAQTFGLGDAVISIAGANGQDADRVRGLVDTLRSIGVGYPADLELHTDWSSPATYDELVAVDRLLTENDIPSPLVFGEASYENAGVASDIARFESQSSRPVEEVFEGFQNYSGGPCASPPYRADAYISALEHTTPPQPTPFRLLPIPTLDASVTKNGAVSANQRQSRREDPGRRDVRRDRRRPQPQGRAFTSMGRDSPRPPRTASSAGGAGGSRSGPMLHTTRRSRIRGRASPAPRSSSTDSAREEAGGDGLCSAPTKSEEAVMHAVVRRYEGNGALAGELATRSDEIKDLIGGIDGFRAYYLVAAGNDTITVSVFDDASGVQESSKAAAAWIKENMPDTAPSAPDVAEGEVVFSM